MGLKQITREEIIKNAINKQRRVAGKEPIEYYPATPTAPEELGEPDLGRVATVEDMGEREPPEDIRPAGVVSEERRVEREPTERIADVSPDQWIEPVALLAEVPVASEPPPEPDTIFEPKAEPELTARERFIEQVKADPTLLDADKDFWKRALGDDYDRIYEEIKGKAEEPKAEEPKAEEPKVEEPKVEEPTTETRGERLRRIFGELDDKIPLSEVDYLFLMRLSTTDPELYKQYKSYKEQAKKLKVKPEREYKTTQISEEDYAKIFGTKKGMPINIEALRKLATLNPNILVNNPWLAKILAEAEMEEELEEEVVELPDERAYALEKFIGEDEVDETGKRIPKEKLEPEPKIAKEPKIVGLAKTELPEYTAGYLNVYLVNGDYMRERYGIPFESGASDKTLPNIVPQNEIWIEATPDSLQFNKNLFQQLLARRLIKDSGMEVEEAKRKSASETFGFLNSEGMIKIAITDEIIKYPEITPIGLVRRNGLAPRLQTKEGALDRRQRLAKELGIDGMLSLRSRPWWEDGIYQPPEREETKERVTVGNKYDQYYLGHKLPFGPDLSGPNGEL